MKTKKHFSKKNLKMFLKRNFSASLFVIILSVSMCMSLVPLTGMVYAQSSVPATARHIKTAEELAAIGGVQSMGEYYVLDNDINLVSEWVPIEDFRGTFDGQGYSINNLYVLASSNRQYAGLFATGGILIKNVGVNIGSKGVTAVGAGSELNPIAYAGGLVGLGGTVTNCYATGDVTSTSTHTAYAGGLIGLGGGVTNCYATGDITATSDGSGYAGGLIGYSSDTVTNCYATGDVRASAPYAYAGGLIGDVRRTTNCPVTNCHATGYVTATSEYVSGSVYAGGLIGNHFGTITNCYAIGNVAASALGYGYAGGLIGEGMGATNCYATGDVTASGAVSAGCIFGTENLASITRCYYISTQKITGNQTNSLGEPLTAKEMQNQQSFITWNFDTVWTINSKVNNGYPTLRGLTTNNQQNSSGSSPSGSSPSGVSSSNDSPDDLSSDGSRLFDNPLVIGGIALIAITAVVAVVVIVKKLVVINV